MSDSTVFLLLSGMQGDIDLSSLQEFWSCANKISYHVSAVCAGWVISFREPQDSIRKTLPPEEVEVLPAGNEEGALNMPAREAVFRSPPWGLRQG